MTRNDLNDISYIGDGVYIGHDGYVVWLFISNGIEDHSFIALEPDMFEAINTYIKRINNKG